MAKGRWGQPPLRHAHDGDACCVQAFVKSVGAVFKRQPVSTSVAFMALRTSDKNLGGSNSFFSGRGASMSPAETERGDVTVHTCCAVKREPTKARTVDTASNTHVNRGRGVACHDIGDSTEQVGREPFTHLEHFGSCSTQHPSSNGRVGPVFYRAAWRKNGCKTFVWKVTSRCAQFSPKSCIFKENLQGTHNALGACAATYTVASPRHLACLTNHCLTTNRLCANVPLFGSRQLRF